MGIRFRTPETAFPALLAVCGLLFAGVLPPCQAPDENKHFLRAFHVSEGHLRPQVTEAGWLGGQLPESVGRVSDGSKYLRFHSSERVDVGALRAIASERLEPDRRRPTSFEGAEANLFVGYLPQAAAIAIGRLVGLNALGLLYAARLANLALAAVALAVALRLAPAGRLVFGMAALLPITVQQVASASPDASIISAAFLSTALLLRAALTGLPSGWSLVARAAALVAWLSLCKFALAPLALLCLGVPRQVIGSWLRYLAGVAVITVAVLLPTYPLAVERSRDAPPGPRQDLPDRPLAPEEQTQSLRKSPITFVTALGNSWREVPYLDHLFTLGWLDAEIPRQLAYPYALLTVFVALASRWPSFPRRTRLAALAAVLGCSLVIFLAFFVFVTPPGDTIIRDVQGRYFIPFLPAVLLLLSNHSRLTRIDPQRLFQLALASGVAVSVVALGTMAGRYYCPAGWALWLLVGSALLAFAAGAAVWFTIQGSQN
jgi:uncharacterized membrane protein